MKDEPLKISDFDILGVIKLKDVEGIEKYVTKLNDTEYLSRGKEYYNIKTITELSEEREELKELLTTELTKKNFVILENMLNCSAKVYFKKLEKNLIGNKNEASGEEYEKYLHLKSYRDNAKNDTKGALHRGILNAERTGLILKEGYSVPDKHYNPKMRKISQRYEEPRGERKIHPIANSFIEKMINNVEELEKDKEENQTTMDKDSI